MVSLKKGKELLLSMGQLAVRCGASNPRSAADA